MLFSENSYKFIYNLFKNNLKIEKTDNSISNNKSYNTRWVKKSYNTHNILS